MDVGENASLGNGDTSEEFVKLLVVSHSQLNVAWDDACLLVVASCIASELEDLGGKIFKDRREVHWGTGTDTSGVFALLEEATHSADGELKSCL